MHDGGAPAQLPQGSTACEMPDDGRFGFGEPEVVHCGVQLVGCLTEDDLRGGVREQSGGDLGGRSSIVGLGDEVRGAMGDAQIGDAVGAAKLETGLEVARRVVVAEQRPRLVEHLDPLRPGAGHELLEPSGRGDHYERQRVGVERHRGQVQHDAGSVPAKRDGGAAVEHAAQRPRQELVERVGDSRCLRGQVVFVAAEPLSHLLGRFSNERGDVGEGRLLDR